MERLKFKIWDKKNKKFLVKCIDTNELKNNVFSYLDWENGSIRLDSKKYIVLQYIGLKDMKGKEIYEGDIVKYIDNFYYKVVYIKESACFVLSPITKNTRIIFSFNFRMSNNKGMEVVGNIFENRDFCKD